MLSRLSVKPPCHTTSLQGGSRESLNQSDRGHRTAERPQHRGAPDLIPRRHLCELAFNEVEIIEDCRFSRRLAGLT
jgi:hypothetical protein